MTRHNHPIRIRRTLQAATCLAVPLLLATTLAACSSGGTGKPAAQQGSPAVSGSETAPPQPSESATGSESPAPGESTPGGAGNRCAAGQLAVSVEAGDSGAGQLGVNLVFGNTSSSPCTMRGYPGVSFMTGDAGQQVNDPARRAAGATVATVTLAAGGSAHAMVRLVQTGNFDESSCRPVQIAGFRIYPPDDTAALFARSAQQACSVKGTGVPEIYPVAPGRSG
jgi:hypothetical protein